MHIMCVYVCPTYVLPRMRDVSVSKCICVRGTSEASQRAEMQHADCKDPG